MNILLISVGKWKKSPEKELFEHYASRLSWQLELKEIESKELSDTHKQKQQEAEKILKAAENFNAHHMIALDERGKTMGSRDFATLLGRWKDEGAPRLAIIIGGHAGLDESVRKKAHRTLSFGAMTWPHLLVRPLIAEQIYRSQCILSGHPYHRD